MKRDDRVTHRSPARARRPNRVVFPGETAVKTNLTRGRGRAPQGARLTMDAPFGSWGTRTHNQSSRQIPSLSERPCAFIRSRRSRVRNSLASSRNACRSGPIGIYPQVSAQDPTAIEADTQADAINLQNAFNRERRHHDPRNHLHPRLQQGAGEKGRRAV